MKTYKQFVAEAYSSREEVNEVVGALARGAARFVPGVQTAYGLYRGTSALMKGDKTGAVLGYGSALPGPAGWGFAAADTARDLMKSSKPSKPTPSTAAKPTASAAAKPTPSTASKPTPSTASKPTPSAASKPTPSAASKPTPSAASKPTPPISQTVLAKKGGVEGKLDKGTGKFTPSSFSAAEKSRYQTVSNTNKSTTPTPKPTTTSSGTTNIKPSPTSTPIKPTPVTPATKPQDKANILGNKPSELAALRAKAKADTLSKKPMITRSTGPRGM